MAFGDFFRIRTNVQSLNAQFSLNKINRELSLTQLRLATGYRIVRAEDDAAGFAIAMKLTSRIASLEQAHQNAGDAKSVLDIAETNLVAITEILVDLKTKATQAANGTYGAEERQFIQQQIEALAGELDALVGQSVFQGRNLLDGTYAANYQVGDGIQDTITAIINSGNPGEGFTASELGLNALDVSSGGDARLAMGAIDQAINRVASSVNQIGIYQTRLSIREEFLSRSIISNSAVRSRIIDTDFAREMSNLIRLQILQQAAIYSLVQANVAPLAVLQLLR